MPDANFNEDDVPYEEDILRNPYSVRCWLRYIGHKRTGSRQAVNLVYERALRELPGSYKLWWHYLKLRRKQCLGKPPGDSAYEDVNNCFERALVFMHKMPRIWLDYCDWILKQHALSRARKIFDRALRALPITQHERIWPLYLRFVTSYNIPETAVRVYRRHLKLCPENAEAFVEYLVTAERLDEAAVLLADIVNNDRFVSKKGKTNHQLWNELCELISTNPKKVHSLKVEPIIRQGLRRFSDQTGRLWSSLANYYIRAGHFEKARDIYEEALRSVVTVRDFAQIFDAYAQFSEHVIKDVLESKVLDEEDSLELCLKMARLEDLMDRRPLLLNSVLLRQNPHNVQEWLKRVTLLKESQPEKIVETFHLALRTVDPRQQTGKVSALWIAFAKHYEELGKHDETVAVFEKATEADYAKVDELATIWCEYCEFELRRNKYENAIKLMKRATKPPLVKTHYFDEAESAQSRVHKSLKVWSMYADLEESFGNFQTCKAVYDRIIDVRIATPQIVINYGMFLEENNHFEESFKAYERGIALFQWPNVFDIWNTYLTKFIKRYTQAKNLEGRKLERARDLFHQCMETCPKEYAKNLYLLWAKMEEEHGQPRRAMEIYETATAKVAKEEMIQIFNIYIKKAAELYGVAHTRPIYEKAVDALPESDAREVCIRFAELEIKLGEIDRARGIYGHCSQICDPRIHTNFWKVWKDFELAHGNEDTMREMLRIKRSVQATYNTQVNYMSAQMLAQSSQANAAGAAIPSSDSMALLEARAQELAAGEANPKTPLMQRGGDIRFVRGEVTEGTAGFGDEKPGNALPETANPDEIDIESDEEDDDDEENSAEEEADAEVVESRAVPSEVFGSLVPGSSRTT